MVALVRTLVVVVLMLSPSVMAQSDYFPGAHPDWERRSPASLGLDAEKLAAAVQFAIENETQHPPELAEILDVRDLRTTVPLTWAREPFSSPIGPLEPRAAPNGLVIKSGYIVATWGPTEEVDMTFSISKTFLSHTAGVAFDTGRLADVHRLVIEDIEPVQDFADPHNAPITWDMMLRQTSGWIGTLWGKPWWADRPGPRSEPVYHDLVRGPPTPGSAYEYNDVRVNALALALTHLWERPLPDVLAEYVMDPIGASDTWCWEGYKNSYTEINGKRVKVVSGGGHWGGGMFINAFDLGRLGLLGLRHGKWGDEQVLSEAWMMQARTPTDVEPGYGYMNWFLNTDHDRFEAAPESAVAYLGAGTNMVYIDYEHELVVVARWLDRSKLAEFVALVTAAAEE